MRDGPYDKKPLPWWYWVAIGLSIIGIIVCAVLTELKP